MADLATSILRYISRVGYQPVKPKALARKMGIKDTDYYQFRKVLRELHRSGQLELGKNHTVRPLNPLEVVAGVFRKTSVGAGYVRPHLPEVAQGQEIYIPPAEVGDASTGDEVLVKLIRRRRRPEGAIEGRILRVLERIAHRFVGTYYEEAGEAWVLVDGTTFAEPIYVGDPAAKGARPHDKVVIEMLRFPSPQVRGEAVITEILGPRGQPGVDTLSIVRAYDLPDTFSAEALDEARHIARRFEDMPRDGRRDFTEDLVITIDPADAKDFDDAVSVRRDAHTRHWHLQVHVADVAQFVPVGSHLDREARERGNSVYLPQCVLPMLPEILSNGLASLQQGKERLVKSVIMEFTSGGQRVHTELCNGLVRVARRFTYDEVTRILAEPQRYRDAVGHGLVDMLLLMQELALILRERRRKRGALELTIPEAELELDDQGRVTGAHYVPHDISHQIIEEFMVAANEAVAEHLQSLGVPFLRRIHPPPDADKLRAFAEFVRHLGYDIDPEYATDRFQLQRVLERSAQRPEVHAVHYALLRSLKQAEYSPYDEGHYALASRHYCHFTSPIRRYPDLTVHRLLDRWLAHGRVNADETELVALGEHCSFTERRADAAERDLVKVKLLDYLSSRLGLEMEAIITGVQDYGFFAQAMDVPVEGLVHVTQLSDDFYYFDEATHSLIGRRTRRRFRLGDRVHVRVFRVNVYRRELDFALCAARPRKR